MQREEPPLPAPLHTTMDAFLAQGDPATQTQLYDDAKAALVAEGVSPWQAYSAGHRGTYAGAVGGPVHRTVYLGRGPP
jgi:hypothetical protein